MFNLVIFPILIALLVVPPTVAALKGRPWTGILGWATYAGVWVSGLGTNPTGLSGVMGLAGLTGLIVAAVSMTRPPVAGSWYDRRFPVIGEVRDRHAWQEVVSTAWRVLVIVVSFALGQAIGGAIGLIVALGVPHRGTQRRELSPRWRTVLIVVAAVVAPLLMFVLVAFGLMAVVGSFDVAAELGVSDAAVGWIIAIAAAVLAGLVVGLASHGDGWGPIGTAALCGVGVGLLYVALGRGGDWNTRVWVAYWSVTAVTAAAVSLLIHRSHLSVNAETT